MLLKKKKPKPEDFIGETFNDGKLMVVGIAERLPSNTKYYVTCTECSKDKEIFPNEYFISTRGSLKKTDPKIYEELHPAKMKTPSCYGTTK